MAAAIKIMEETSPTQQDMIAEITESIRISLMAVRFFTLRIRVVNQAKKPASLSNPTKTIIPTKNRITSKEANFIRFSKSTGIFQRV